MKGRARDRVYLFLPGALRSHTTQQQSHRRPPGRRRELVSAASPNHVHLSAIPTSSVAPTTETHYIDIKKLV